MQHLLTIRTIYISRLKTSRIFSGLVLQPVTNLKVLLFRRKRQLKIVTASTPQFLKMTTAHFICTSEGYGAGNFNAGATINMMRQEKTSNRMNWLTCHV